MARPSRTPAATMSSNPDTRTRAAYAASQPLFDSIRKAVDALDEQKIDLITARTVVQRVHVTLPIENLEDTGLVHETFIERLLKAWKSTTNSYLGVFEQLLKLQASDEAHGKLAGPLFEEFEALKESVEKARDVVLAFNPAANPPQSPIADRSADALDAEMEDASARSASSQKRVKLSHTNESTAAQQRKGPKLSNEQLEIQAAQERGSGCRPWDKPNKHQDPRQIALKKAKQEVAHAGQTGAGANFMPKGAYEEAEQQVLYADVTAEAEASLQAKRDAKKEKKRKRDSLGSGIVAAEVGGEEKALQARDERLKERPAKKKVKDARGDAMRVDAGEGEKKGKGKRGTEGEVVVEEAGEGRKKRRKKSKQC